MHSYEKKGFPQEYCKSKPIYFKLESDQFTNILTANAFNSTRTGNSESPFLHLIA